RYLAIERVRFSDRLRTTFSVDPELEDAAVPAFILQPLIENALRHGLAKRSDAGMLEIGARRDKGDLVLWVRDDGPGLDQAVADRDAERERVGLANTRERLTTLYGARGALELTSPASGGTLATVRLPYHVLPPAESRDA